MKAIYPCKESTIIGLENEDGIVGETIVIEEYNDCIQLQNLDGQIITIPWFDLDDFIKELRSISKAHKTE
jgi:hypothetical protein